MTSIAGDNVLGQTARWTAAARARESARAEALLSDPWAEALAGDVGMTWIAARPPDSTLPIVLRTRYFDDYLQRVGGEGIRQFVLLAAGLDTRAYRLPWPDGATVYEVDQAGVVAYKEHAMSAVRAEPRCRRVAVGADLTEPWEAKLIDAGLAPEQPACFLLDGFLFYLPTAALERVLDQVLTFAAAGSRVGFDVVNGAMLTSPYTKPWLDMQAAAGAPWVGVLDDPIAFLAARDWDAGLTQAGQPDASHGRWTLPVLPTTLPNAPHNWFVTGAKREG